MKCRCQRYYPEGQHRHPHLCSSLDVKGQVSLSYKTTAEIIVLFISNFVLSIANWNTADYEQHGTQL
jgi:hypothetical protein